LLQRYTEVFKDGLGTLKNYKAKIYIDPKSTPCFYKTHSVPFSVRSLVDDELDKLTKEDVIEPVQFSDWAYQ